MSRTTGFAFTAIAAVMLATLVSANEAGEQKMNRQIPLRDFFRNPEQADYLISPDGSRIACQKPYKGRMNVFVRPVAGGEETRVTGETARDIAGYAWKGSNRIIYTKDFGGDENFHIVSVNLKGEDLKDLTPFEKVRAEVIDDLRDHDTDVLVGLNKRDPKVFVA